MKKILFLFFCSFFIFNSFSQDVFAIGETSDIDSINFKDVDLKSEYLVLSLDTKVVLITSDTSIKFKNHGFSWFFTSQTGVTYYEYNLDNKLISTSSKNYEVRANYRPPVNNLRDLVLEYKGHYSSSEVTIDYINLFFSKSPLPSQLSRIYEINRSLEITDFWGGWLTLLIKSALGLVVSFLGLIVLRKVFYLFLK